MHDLLSIITPCTDGEEISWRQTCIPVHRHCHARRRVDAPVYVQQHRIFSIVWNAESRRGRVFVCPPANDGAF